MIATTADAYQLLQEGAIALAAVEANGFRIDLAYLDQQISGMEKKIRTQEALLTKGQEWRLWRQAYGEGANLGSPVQLRNILFERLGYPLSELTEKSKVPKVDEEALEKIDRPFVKEYVRWKKLQKIKSTYLDGFKRECEGEYLHPFYHLAGGDDDKGGAISYRSSGSSPNTQNIPSREGEMAELVRRMFIPRPGCQLIEIDFKVLEVVISAVYHHDPTLIAYIKDPGKDMHRDTAMDCYLLRKEEVSKDARYCAKNGFVFPEFYGSYYKQCAPPLWDNIRRKKLRVQTPDGPGMSLKKHLRRKGIRELGACDHGQDALPGTFEHVIKKVEEQFWNVRFPVYTAWKRSWWEAYLRDGYFDLLTGFHVEGVYRKNQVLNIPIQGVAFHCNLWVIKELIKWIRKKRMKAKVIGQVHDSSIGDVPEEEVSAYRKKVKELIKVGLPNHWKWLDVPLNAEAKIAPPGKSWWEAKEVPL